MILARLAEDLVTTDLDFEHMLSMLLSKERFHGASGHLPPSAWRGQLKDIFRAVKRAAHRSIQGDQRHRAAIEARCELAIEDLGKCRTTDKLSVTAIRHLTRIVFLLMGEWPRNWDKTAGAASHPSNWRLDRLRSLHYLRTPAQLFQEVLDLTERPEYEKQLPTKGDLWNRLSRIHKGDYEEFLHWFKQQYPSLYLALV